MCSGDEVRAGRGSEGSKVCVGDDTKDFKHAELKECDNSGGGGFKGDTRSELQSKLRSPLKRARENVGGDDSLSVDLKKAKSVGIVLDDEPVNVSVGGVDFGGGNAKDGSGSVGLKEMLNWLIGVAKDPCSLRVEALPEISDWDLSEGNDLWKQVLRARESIMCKRCTDLSSEQLTLQKSQKMHPRMYDDSSSPSYNTRERLKRKQSCSPLGGSPQQSSSSSVSTSAQSILEKKSFSGEESGDNGGESSSDLSPVNRYGIYPRQKVRLGSNYQAEVLSWSRMNSDFHSKWLGTQIWPLLRQEQRILIERDPVGKGRQDSCGCEVRGSVECVRFHIAEKTRKLKIELGSAFYTFKFDKNGETVKGSWTEDDQNKFASAIPSISKSEDKHIWDEMMKLFPSKSRKDLLCYFFNVFLLQRRAYQNRFTQDHIDTDDEEIESSENKNFILQQKPLARRI